MNQNTILQLWETGFYTEGEAMRELGVSRAKARILKQEALAAGEIQPESDFDLAFTIAENGGAPETVMLSMGEAE